MSFKYIKYGSAIVITDIVYFIRFVIKKYYVLPEFRIKV